MDGKFYVDCNGSLRTITWKDDDDDDDDDIEQDIGHMLKYFYMPCFNGMTALMENLF